MTRGSQSFDDYLANQAKQEKEIKLTDEGCREQALYFAKCGNHHMSMRWYNTAAARTIGHKKTDDYKRLAKEQAKLGSFQYEPGNYANEKNGDAADIKYSWQ